MVAENERLSEESRENYERYRQIFNIAPAGIYEVDFQTGKFINVNDAISDYSGYTKAELLSMNAIDVLTEESQKLLIERTGKMLSGERVPNSVDYEIIRKDGRLAWLNVTNRFIYQGDKIVGSTVVARDVTEKKRLESELQRSEEHLRSLMENASNFAVYRLARDDQNPHQLRVVFVSPSVREIVGIRDPMKFETWFENMHPDDVAHIVKANQEAFQTMRFDEEYRTWNPYKNDWRWIHAISTGTQDEEKWTGYVNGIMIDITERKLAEEALRERDKELNAKANELEEINTTLKVLLEQRIEDRNALKEKIIIHIREKVLPYIDKLKRTRLSAKQKICTEMIESSIDHMVSPFISKMATILKDLTPTEFRIAELIQHGRTTKEIAELISLSPRTIDTHRRSIRRKLGIANQRINLRSHLLSLT